MIVRDFNNSKDDLDELIAMYVDLCSYDNDIQKSYAEKVGELYKSLYKNGARCFMVCIDEAIVGFAIIYKDELGGVIAQSLYVKESHRGTILFGRFLTWLEKWVEEAKFPYCTVIATNEHTYKMYDKRYEKQYSIYKFIPKGV